MILLIKLPLFNAVESRFSRAGRAPGFLFGLGSVRPRLEMVAGFRKMCSIAGMKNQARQTGRKASCVKGTANHASLTSSNKMQNTIRITGVIFLSLLSPALLQGQTVPSPTAFEMQSVTKIYSEPARVLQTATISVDSASINFDQVPANSSDSRSVRISNIGDTDLNVSSIALVDSRVDFGLIGSTSFVLAPRATRSVTVRFSPTGIGTQRDTLLIVSNDDAMPVLQIPIIGVGVPDVPDIRLDSISYDFGSVATGFSANRTIGIRNTGSSDLEISEVFLLGTDPTEFSLGALSLPLAIIPQDKKIINVQFRPTSAGEKTAVLRIENNDPGENPTDVELIGAGQAPNLNISHTAYDFGTVNVGASADQTFLLTNNGTVNLSINSILLSGADASEFAFVRGQNSGTLIPNQSRELVIRFNPTSGGDKAASVRISSNDPDTGILNVPLSATARPVPYINANMSTLVFSRINIGDSTSRDLTISNIGTEVLVIDSVTITGPSAIDFQIQSELPDSLGTGQNQRITIQFKPQTEGLKNTPLTIYSNDPDSAQFEIILNGVADPRPDLNAPTITFSQQTDTTSNLNSNILIRTTVADLNSIASVRLLYREGGQNNFQSTTMRHDGGGIYSGTIPAAIVNSRGVEYAVEARDEFDNDTTSSVFSISVRMPDRQLTKSNPGGGSQSAYRLISMPLMPDNATVATALLDDLGPADTTQWRLWTIDPAAADSVFPFREYPEVGPLTPGRAFFLITRNSKTLTSPAGVTASTSAPFEIELQSGWNMIASPFNFNVPIENVEPAELRADLYEIPNGQWRNEITHLQPWQGYMVKVPEATTLRIHPSERVAGNTFGKEHIEADWRIRLLAKAAGSVDAFNYVGVLHSASAEWDEHELYEPPPIGNFVMLSFRHLQWQFRPDVYTTDFRAPSDAGHQWQLSIDTNIGATPVSVRIEDLATVPAGYDIQLVDAELGIAQDMRRQPEYIYRSTSAGDRKTLTLLVGNPNFVAQQVAEFVTLPKTFELTQNFPNPFNPTTNIRYSLPERARVSLIVYNLLGQEVRTLIDHAEREAGYAIEIWDGRDDRDEALPSGVYIYRMQTAEIALSKKMLLIK